MSTHVAIQPRPPYTGPLRIVRRRSPADIHSSCADRVHPAVYKAMIGLVVIWIVATTAFWVGASDTGDVFIFATFLIVVAVAIPLVLSRIGRRSAGASFERGADGSFRDWRRGGGWSGGNKRVRSTSW